MWARIASDSVGTMLRVSLCPLQARGARLEPGETPLPVPPGSLARLNPLPTKVQFCAARHIGHGLREGNLSNLPVGLEVVMSSIKRLARAARTWLTRPGRVDDLTNLSDRDLRDLGLVRRQIGINHQQVISVGNFL
jgi:uncharacterized protein YjiS (DUF1127 family)